jgi:ankyrin repeat protein
MVELILKYVEPKFIKMDYNVFFDSEYNFDRTDTPLMAACATGNLCIVKALLRKNADVNECNYRKKSPVFSAQTDEYSHASLKSMIQIHQTVLFSTFLRKHQEMDRVSATYS